MSDIRHALRKARFRLSHHGFEEDARIVNEELEKLNDIVNKHQNDSDDGGVNNGHKLD